MRKAWSLAPVLQLLRIAEFRDTCQALIGPRRRNLETLRLLRISVRLTPPYDGAGFLNAPVCTCLESSASNGVNRSDLAPRTHI